MITTDIIYRSELRNCELCNRDISEELSFRGLSCEEASRSIGLCCYEQLDTIEHVSIPDSMRPEEMLAILDQLRCASQGIQLTIESPDPTGNTYSLYCPGITQLRSSAGSYTDTEIPTLAQRVPHREWPDNAKKLAEDVNTHSMCRDKLVLFKWPDGVITAFHVARHQKKVSKEELIGYYRKAAIQLVRRSTYQ